MNLTAGTHGNEQADGMFAPAHARDTGLAAGFRGHELAGGMFDIRMPAGGPPLPWHPAAPSCFLG